jgi:hypothetical protein
MLPLCTCHHDWRNIDIVEFQKSHTPFLCRCAYINTQDIVLKVTNLNFLQPFGPFVVITHNKEAPPLFTLGSPSSPELARLAEDGTPVPLVNLYAAMDGVGEAFAFTEGVPFFGGESLEITIPRSPDYPYVSVASMGNVDERWNLANFSVAPYLSLA